MHSTHYEYAWPGLAPLWLGLLRRLLRVRRHSLRRHSLCQAFALRPACARYFALLDRAPRMRWEGGAAPLEGSFHGALRRSSSSGSVAVLVGSSSGSVAVLVGSSSGSSGSTSRK